MASGLPRSLALGLLLCAPLAQGSPGPWEWAGTFDLSVGHYTWSCTKSASGTYADASAKILVLPISDTSEESLEAVESTAVTQWATSTAKSSYDEIETGSTYTLNFDVQTWTTHFILHIDTAGAYAVFFEHSPYEFENGFHYLKSEGGDDVEHVFEEEGDHNHSHAEHEEEEHCPWELEWEWSAIFPVQAGWYDWNAQKVDDAYADATMKIVIMSTTGTDLHDLEAQADTHWDAIGNNHVEAGETIPLDAGTTLHFNTETWASHFKIYVPAGTSHIAVFAEHFPTEFESAYHFLRSASGEDIEPVAEESGAGCATATAASTTSEDDSKIWGEVLAAAFITVLPTLVGIVLVVMTCMPQLKAMMAGEGGFVAAIHSFASGVIFAAAVFLLLPEGLYLITVGKTEAGGSGMWGTSVMAGWIFCIMIKQFCQLVMGESTTSVVPTTNGETDQEPQKVKGTSWLVSFPILFGDMFHNFSDGLVLGVAFKTCGASFGWKIAGVTVLHEIPQELSDFAVLITKGRMAWPMALTLNFMSGLSTVVGAIITYSIDVSSGVEGALLAAGAGVYLYVAMTDLGPAVGELMGDRALGAVARLLSFAVGATLIGLVLLDHEHCYAPVVEGEEVEAEAADDGHGHGH
jgi:zinc transporter ZupT